MSYEVIESRVWRHKVTGRKVSIYGALPFWGDSDKESWEIVPQGWTVRNLKDGTVGIGRVPWKTQADAQAWADKANRPCTCMKDHTTCLRHSEAVHI